jgi:ribulose-bisphosphate carboxylase small chain
VSVEHTDDPHPRNTYWEMHGMPQFEVKNPETILEEIRACRRTFPEHYVRVLAFDATRGWETPRMAFIVNRPKHEPRLRLERQEAAGRTLRYTVRA